MSGKHSFAVPEIRVRVLNEAPARKNSKYVLYWMVANRRLRSNFSLQRAFQLGAEFDLPIVILETLRIGYQWASDRLHTFVIDGMRDKADALKSGPILYYPYIEPTHGAGSGLLKALAAEAVVVVTDDYPCFFLPHMTLSAAKKLDVRLEAVDGNGILPMRAADRVFETAYSFRRFLQKVLPAHLEQMPMESPLDDWQEASKRRRPSLPDKLESRWPMATRKELGEDRNWLADLQIDHSVGISPIAGGNIAAAKQLRQFLRNKLKRYSEDRSEPAKDVASGLSPYLHFGHLGVHEAVSAVLKHEKWNIADLSNTANGSKEGWWGCSPSAEAFLDELITWREIGFNFCSYRTDYDQFESLPEWARVSLRKHAKDRRTTVYTLEQFETAKTHDELWNAAQTQLVEEGRIHNYLRMLWGKKILEWSESPEEALAVMIELNNKYAIDGRDPNSYSGIFWTLGRYDRPWGPERPIFGVIRYMSSDNTARKFDVKPYLAKYSNSEKQGQLF